MIIISKILIIITKISSSGGTARHKSKANYGHLEIKEWQRICYETRVRPSSWVKKIF